MQRSEKAFAKSILVVRKRRVVVDEDLARIYGVPTWRLNEAVRRNRRRFPSDFAFQLTVREWSDLISQSAISSAQPESAKGLEAERRVPAPHRHGGRRTRPWAYTEHGALMAAYVLRSARAVRMSVYVVRAFVRMRERLHADASILRRLAEIDATLLSHDRALRETWQAIRPLLAPPPEPARRRIGFQVRDAIAHASSSRG
jgi:hypothetical protein